jgi:hypothetical protein
MTNRSLAAAKGWARRRQEWDAYLALHNGPDRVWAFLRILDELDGPTYWRLFREVWTASELFNECQDLWHSLLVCHPLDRSAMMTDEENGALASLPSEVEVFRGVGHADLAAGFSWTLDRACAEWFARRFAALHASPILVTGHVSRPDVIAYLEARQEHEVISLPENVRIGSVEPVTIVARIVAESRSGQ